MNSDNYLLIINDVQAKSVARLRPDRRDVYAPQIEAHARAVRPHMKIIWVAISDGFRIYADSITQPMNRDAKTALVEKLGLPKEAAEGHDDIVTKTIRNAFGAPSTLEQHIRSTYPAVDTLVHAGMSTLCCIPENVVGSTKAGFNNLIHHDLLADENIHLRGEKKPNAHKGWLSNHHLMFDVMHGAGPKPVFMTTSEFKEQQGMVPPRPSVVKWVIDGFAAVARSGYRP